MIKWGGKVVPVHAVRPGRGSRGIVALLLYLHHKRKCKHSDIKYNEHPFRQSGAGTDRHNLIMLSFNSFGACVLVREAGSDMSGLCSHNMKAAFPDTHRREYS